VVAMGAVGSGCSAGKRCLTIDQIALKGVVRSEAGMIAVVVNAVDKAYFLRENDPVFNGYVVKITGDSIIFKETFHDRLGKTLTRDVTKTITRPVA
jgi:Tfp pilus assembly protein PilP